jgi:predicted DNA-binding transcriptional regulator YafY
MPANRNALLRYKVIDQCLQNRHRKWTLQDLIGKVSDALYEYEGKKDDISIRTIQLDIQTMRSDKLGYNAPIIVKDKKYYSYEDPEYSITKIPITKQDLERLSDTIDFLKQFKGFTHFKDLSGMVQRMEDHIYVAKTRKQAIIQFETNQQLKGIEHLDFIYRAIMDRKVICLSYQSFKAKRAQELIYHPYILKEYNNRWFVIGNIDNSTNIQVFALDRIISLQQLNKPIYRTNPNFDGESFFKDIIGVTVMEGSPIETITIKASLLDAPYLITKPIHTSQKILERQEDGVLLQFTMKVNPELERMLLGFGAGIEVLSPRLLRNKMKRHLEKALERYG